MALTAKYSSHGQLSRQTRRPVRVSPVSPDTSAVNLAMVQNPYLDQNVDLRPSGLPTVQNPYVDTNRSLAVPLETTHPSA